MDKEKQYLAKFVELKSFVKQMGGETAMKFMGMKDDEAKKSHILQRFSKIREKIDKLEEDLVSEQLKHQIRESNQSDQEGQLNQVKQILTGFLQQAGKQMKNSEDDFNTVINIINLDKDVIQQSTNSLIIKLWNTILTSVGEFQKTYKSNQLEVSQKLDVMDGKLDAIMDKIEAGQNEVLLELYKMSKVQDLYLDQTLADKSNVKVQDITFQNVLQFQIKELEQKNDKKQDIDTRKYSSEWESQGEESKVKEQQPFGKYSDNIMSYLKEKNKNAFEKIQMRRNKETEWNQIDYISGQYEGELIKSTYIRNGFGINISDAGDVYEGQWKDDRFHGFGEEQLSNGYYIGQFIKDKREGFDIYFYNNGRIQKGEWKEGYKHGLGITIFENKDIQIGKNFLDSFCDGEHVKISANNDIYKIIYKKNEKIKEKKLGKKGWF